MNVKSLEGATLGRLLVAVVLALLAANVASAYKEVPPPEKVVLPVARTAAESLASISVPPGMEVELVAAEPEVMDPIDIAWDADGRRLAFAIPDGVLPRGAVLPGLEGDDRNPAGVFVFDRRDGSLERVEGSLGARRLSFPEFVGKDRLLFLLPRDANGGSSRFRLVCCLR